MPTYQLEARGPDAAKLVSATRSGSAAPRRAVTRSCPGRSRTAASSPCSLKLERTPEPLPGDSTMMVRPRSALGLKYVEVTRGRSREGYQDGDTIRSPRPSRRSSRRVLQHVRRARGPPTRRTSRASARARRPRQDLNAAIGAFRPAARLIPVMRNLSEPRDRALAGSSRSSATRRRRRPASGTQAALFRGLDARWLRCARSRARTCRTRSPGATQALDTASEPPDPAAVPRQHRGLFRELQPGCAGAARRRRRCWRTR